MAKYEIDMEKLKGLLQKETPIAQITTDMGFSKEVRPYIYNAIKKLQKGGYNIVKVKPGVFKLVN